MPLPNVCFSASVAATSIVSFQSIGHTSDRDARPGSEVLGVPRGRVLKFRRTSFAAHLDSRLQ